jgi:hypothetical protein
VGIQVTPPQRCEPSGVLPPHLVQVRGSRWPIESGRQPPDAEFQPQAVSQVISKPHLNQVASYRRRDNPDSLSLVRAHFDLLAIGPGLETARIGLSRPRGRRPGHRTSGRPEVLWADAFSTLTVDFAEC